MGEPCDVRVFMQVPERREWRVPAGTRVGDLLRQLGFSPESVLVIEGHTLRTADDVLRAGAEIELRPPISGGAP